MPVVSTIACVAVLVNVGTALWVKLALRAPSWLGQDTHFARLQTDAKPDFLGEGQRVIQILTISDSD